MRSARTTVSAALTATVLGAALSTLALPATAAAATTCQGRPVTVTGTVGTEGDDVMLVEPGQYATVQALAGNDLICIVATPLDDWRHMDLDAGPGDDAVVNDSTDVDSAMYSVSLGEGADSYRGLAQAVGSDVFEEVYAGTRGSQASGATDTAADTITTGGGDDIVYSGPITAGAPNADVVRSGSGADTAHWTGEQTASTTLDLGTGANILKVYRGWQATSIVVDAGQHLATGDGRPLLRWAGDVTEVDLQLDNRDLTFVGTDAAETIRMGSSAGVQTSAPPVGSRSALLGRGDDSLVLYSPGSGTIDGGRGTDRFHVSACGTARLRIGGTSTCTTSANPQVSHTFDLASFEDLLVLGDDVSLRGSDRGERVKVVADRIRLQGGGGPDLLNPNASLGSTAYDTPVVVSGGRGDDRVLGTHTTDLLRGGPGDDRLFGQAGDDAILGGTGRDKAVGKDGNDRCSAEVRRTCKSR